MPFHLSITAPPGQGETENAERLALAHIVGGVAAVLGDGKCTGGTLRDRDGRTVGEWSYEPMRSGARIPPPSLRLVQRS